MIQKLVWNSRFDNLLEY